jgi:hypothetical protein
LTIDDRDARAVDRGVVRFLAAIFVFWIVWVVIPLAIGGLTRADAAVVAAVALAAVGLAHFVRLTSRSRQTVSWGPLAGLGAADAWEVTEAVRKGRAVSDRRLAPPAVAYARQQLRWQSISRITLPVLVGLRAVDLVVTPPEGAEHVASAAVMTATLAVFAAVSFVGYRRAAQSEERNAPLSG